MYESVLVHADIDEGAKVCDVGDDSGADHPGFEVRDLVDVVAVADDLKLRAGISSRFFKLLNDVIKGEFSDCVLELGVSLEICHP